MEPPVAASGPMLRRAATFSHRTERALKDVNGRVGSMNKSQEGMSTPKSALDTQKVTRAGKQYSAVTSRYAAPLASKKLISTSGDGSQSWRTNVTKLPFVTGKSAPQHKRGPSSDNVSSVQPAMVFAASAHEAKQQTLAKKGEVRSSAAGSKRPRVLNRTSVLEKKPVVQARAARFSSLDRGRCSCSMNGLVRGSVNVSSSRDASLLYSAAHWLELIKLAEGEKKHEVVIDLFRLAISLAAEPRKDVVGQLRRYQESYPGDEIVSALVQQCEGTQQEVRAANVDIIDKSVCEPEESKGAASKPVGDVLEVAPESTRSIVLEVVLENGGAAKKDVEPKRPHFTGRMLSRSSTFSCVDADSRSQHAKAEYGKKLAKTMEFLATQAAAHSASKTGEVAETRQSEILNLPSSGVESTCLSTPFLEIEGAPGLSVGSKLLELASRVGSKLSAQPASENFSSRAPEARCSLPSELHSSSAEKPLNPSSEVLDGESSGLHSLGIQSSPPGVVVDLILHGNAALVGPSIPGVTETAPLVPFSAIETVSKSPSTLAVEEPRDVEKLSVAVPALGSPSLRSEEKGTPTFQCLSSNVELVSEVVSQSTAEPALSRPSDFFFEERPIRSSAVCDAGMQKPVDSLSEWLDGESSEKGTPEIQSAESEATVDLSPDGRGAVRSMDVDSLMREVVSHILPDHIINSTSDFKVPELNSGSSEHEFRTGGDEGVEQSMTEIVENISRSHRHSLSAEAVLMSVRGGVEEKVKLFTKLAEVRGASSGLTESPDGVSDSEGGHESEAHPNCKDVVPGTPSASDNLATSDSPVDTSGMPSSPMYTVSAVNQCLESECGTSIPVDAEVSIVRDECSKVPRATPLRRLTKQSSMKADTSDPFVPATPSAETPPVAASVRILRSRHRRASSVGNMTTRGTWDMTVECSPFGSSPSGQTPSSKSTRLSRGSKEVTPRVDLPKPSWKSIVEREMKGSKLKAVLSAKLPKETSPLAEYVQSQMENQTRGMESGSNGANEKNTTSTCSPSRRVTRLTKSCSKSKVAVKEAHLERVPEPKTARKGDREIVADTTGCPTPGSTVRRSARIHSKVQSLFKDESVHS